ncbi:MAG TPA: hypothetical protein VGH99_14475 [Pseudonocardia sp.]|jgi:hypothetical protein
MSATAEGDPERSDLATELTRDPRPVVHRAALASRYPAWGAATMGLFVVGLVVAFVALRPLAESIGACVTDPDRLVCRPRMHPVIIALPVVSLVAGLALSLIGGRGALRLGGSPLIGSALGWAVFVAGVVAAFVLSAAH